MTAALLRKREHVAQILQMPGKEVVVFWWQVPESEGRDHIAKEIESWSIGALVAAYVLRDNLFQSPNSLQSDVARVINSCRARFENVDSAGSRIAVFILSKSPFSLPETSSPADLPSWLPVHGGKSVLVPIVDLTWAADCPLNSPEANNAEISTLLYDIEGLLLNLILSRWSKDKGAANALLSRVHELVAADKKSNLPVAVKLEDYVAMAKANHGKLNRIGFRPTSSSLESFLGVVLRLCAASSPENIHKVGDALCASIGLEEATLASWSRPVSLLPVLLRPTQPQKETLKAYSRSLLLTIYGAAQLNTASAHADQYPVFSRSLVESISRNFVDCLKIYVSQLSDLLD